MNGHRVVVVVVVVVIVIVVVVVVVVVVGTVQVVAPDGKAGVCHPAGTIAVVVVGTVRVVAAVAGKPAVAGDKLAGASKAVEGAVETVAGINGSGKQVAVGCMDYMGTEHRTLLLAAVH